MSLPTVGVPLPTTTVTPNAGLEQPLWAWLAAAVALLLLAWTAWSWRRKKAVPANTAVDEYGDPPRFFLRTRTATGVVMTLLSGLLAANAYVGYFPTLGALGSLLLGGSLPHIERIVIPSMLAGTGGRQAYVYLPPGYWQGARRYPVLYLIHGNPGDPIDYFRAGLAGNAETALLDRHQVQPVILVSMQESKSFTFDSECLDAVHGPQEERYLTDVVVPFIDAHYRTVADRSARGIGGFSSGAFCALNIALRHQGEFSVVLAEQPYADPGAGPDRDALGGNPALIRANSPDRYLPGLTITAPLTVYMDAPAGDETVGQGRLLVRLLTEDHVPAGLRILDGTHHSWLGVQIGFPGALVFASQHLRAR